MKSLWKNLSRIVAGLVAILALVEISKNILGGQFVSKQLLLLSIVFGVAVYIQHGNELLERLKRAGPVEFFSKEASPIMEELQTHISDKWERTSELSEREKFRYEQAEILISNLQFFNIEKSSQSTNPTLHRLLLRLGRISLDEGKYSRAIDRLRLLIKLSNGDYRSAETYSRCLLAYVLLTNELNEELDQSDQPQDRQEQASQYIKSHQKDLYEQALELADEATQRCKDYRLYHYKAYVQDELGMLRPALKSIDKALHLNHRFAPSKYNKAVTQIKLGKFSKAYLSLLSLEKDDEGIGITMQTAKTDPELDRLRTHPEWKDKFESFLAARKDW